MRNLATPKRILITGASRGIGREAAIQLAALGHTIVLAARDERALHALADDIAHRGGHAEVLALDVTDDTSVERAIERMLATGPCDVVVNNAGTCDQAEFMRQTVVSQRAEMELNYWGALRLTRAVLPAMIQRKRGLIVNVSSILGSVASPTTATYCGSKAALEAWSFGLRGEVGRFGVQVTVFVAPHTQTELGARAKFDGVKSMPVKFTAKELVRAIDRAPRKHAPGPLYALFLLLGRLVPTVMEAQMATRTRRLLSA